MEVNTGKKHLKKWKNCYYKQYKNRCEVIAKNGQTEQLL